MSTPQARAVSVSRVPWHWVGGHRDYPQGRGNGTANIAIAFIAASIAYDADRS